MTEEEFIAVTPKPSDLVALALKDMRMVKKSKRYKFNVGIWHTPVDGTCHVCVAGAVMAGTLGADWRKEYDVTDFSPDVYERLDYLDDLREGCPYSYLYSSYDEVVASALVGIPKSSLGEGDARTWRMLYNRLVKAGA